MRRATLPFWTVVIGGLAALVFVVPELQSLLVYNREAVAHGELWRLVTGNLVHFSLGHVLKDGAALLAAGLLLEARRPREFRLVVLVAAAAVGVVLYAVAPQVLVYGGLSGVAIAAMVYLCLDGLGEARAYGWACRLALAGIGAKLAIELAGGGLPATGFTLVPTSHVTGALVALAVFCALRPLNALAMASPES